MRFAHLACIASVGLLSSNAIAQQGGAPPPPPMAGPPPGAAWTPPPEAANKPAQNTIYAEGLGAGLLYSINYERMVLDELGVRAGFGYWSVSAGAGSAESKASYMTIPLTVSYIGIRGRKSSLEVGGGLTFAYASGSASTIGAKAEGSGVQPFGTANVGYRLHPVDGGGFHFRIGAMVLVGKGLSFSDNFDPNKIGMIPWGYLSMGGSF